MKVFIIRTILRFVPGIILLFQVSFFSFFWMDSYVTLLFRYIHFREEKRNNFMVYNVLIENRNSYMYKYDIDTPFVSFYSQTLSARRCEISVAQA